MGVLDGLFDFLSPKGKSDPKEDGEDEYALGVLSVGDFPVTDALLKRRQYEELCSRYGLSKEKEGGFI